MWDTSDFDTMFTRLEDITKRDRGESKEADAALLGGIISLSTIQRAFIETLANHPDFGTEFIARFETKLRILHKALSSHLERKGSTHVLMTHKELIDVFFENVLKKRRPDSTSAITGEVGVSGGGSGAPGAGRGR